MDLRKMFSTFLLLAVIVSSWKGYVAIFEKDASEPRQIFPTTVDSLPEADQEALKEGILIRNDRDLQALLEDYLS